MKLVSIVIATYNSSGTLQLVLTTLKNQLYDQNKIEILVVDGGSLDDTLKIAKQFHCRIIHNSHVEPLYAKYLGFIQATGKYVMYIDHDEVLINNRSVQNRIDVFKRNSYVKAVTGSGYYSPTDFHIINSYINEFGDPFSFFMYRLSKHADFFVQTMRKRYVVKRDSREYIVFDLSKKGDPPLIELAAGGGMVDRRYMVASFPEIMTKHYAIPHLLHILRTKSPYIAIMKNDPILHFSADGIGSYIKKLMWRIKNNIFFKTTTGTSGYSGRERYSRKDEKWRKFLFIPYALTIVFPFIDALSLIYTRKNIAYIIHVPLAVMTGLLILYYYVLRSVGYKPTLRNYDGTVQAYEE